MKLIQRHLNKYFTKLKYKVKVLLYSKSYSIINEPNDLFKILYKIKDATYENIKVQEVYKINKEYIVPCYHERQNILLINNATITNGSDIICTNNGVIWDKYYLHNFFRFIPLDSNLYTYNKKNVVIIKNRNTITIEGQVLSLIGVHANIWAHFLMQFLPKLYYYKEAGYLNQNINLIIPPTKDKQIIQIIFDQITSFKNINIITAQDGVDYICNELYYIPTTANYPNHGYISPSTTDTVIPLRVLDSLKRNLINRYVNNKLIVDKIYLVRRNTFRCIKNYEEIESYFSRLGFKLIEPHLLTLEEKVSIFNNAKIIVGPYSAAFMNTLFCNHNTKILIFSCLERIQESIYTRLAQIPDCKILYVSGTDETTSPHTNFHIELSKIKEAYNYLLKTKPNE